MFNHGAAGRACSQHYLRRACMPAWAIVFPALSSFRKPSQAPFSDVILGVMSMRVREETRQKVQELLDAANKGNFVQNVQGIMALLRQDGLIYHQVLHCRQVCVHECNRDGMGASGAHVRELMDDVFQLGWAESELRCVCIELALQSSSVAFSAKIARESHGILAPVEDGHARYGSVSGTHINQVLRCLHYGMQHTNPEMTVDGKLSTEKVAAADPAFSRAVREGIPWQVVSHCVVDAFPNLPELISSAHNIAGQIAKAESELQLCGKIVRCVAGRTEVRYADVSAAVLRSKPPGAGTVPFLFAFVTRASGGPTAPRFVESESYIRARGFPRRALGPDFFDNLSSDLRSSEQHVPWRHMVFKVAYTASEKCLSSSDVKRSLSGKDLSKVTEAEGRAQKARELIGGLVDQQRELAMLALGDLEVQLCLLVLDKKEKRHKEAQS